LAPRIVLAVPPQALAAVNQSVDKPNSEADAEINETEVAEPTEAEISEAGDGGTPCADRSGGY